MVRAVRLLVVDDDPGIRALLRETFEGFDLVVDEAGSAEEATKRVRRACPDVIVLDLRMPGIDGLALCQALKSDPATREIGVILLTGANVSPEDVRRAGADALLGKPFSPLDLLGIVERLAGRGFGVPFRRVRGDDPQEQLLLYARDLRHVLELEREQRLKLQEAYRDTVGALASALEHKDTQTRAHSQRVQRYALDLIAELDPHMAADPRVEYGLLLHDIGKIAIPDSILLKPGPLTPPERRTIQHHTILGEQMLQHVEFLQGEALRIVRSHHERWDGAGYPDRLHGEEIPLGARVFAVVDALDAMTTDRPYRRALPWRHAVDEIIAESGRQFAPEVVDAFRARESELQEVRAHLVAA
ncbi:MAG: response regulator [Thermoleophilia bacterium]|nr:response regulator [Thermoleophilia bacterium]